MLININQASHRPIYLQIVDEVRRAIAVGTLQAEDSLPSVRQTAVDLRINPNTVQQAYRELEREGIVHVRRGRGTFVTGLRDSADERKELARSLAITALQEAQRHGFNLDELIDALRLEAAGGSTREDQS
ncbi:MAG: GntR family transcriptional regulator [Thermoanaerobaculia bacterium]|nr:GntR family transcriptional regulator [Thermoanaerobaculia bacterium]